MGTAKIHMPSPVMRHESWLKTASVAGSKGDFLDIASGYVRRAVSTSTIIAGLLDADWTNDANNTTVDVLVDELGIYEMTVTGTLAQATHVGNAYDLTDHDTLNLGGTTYKVIVVVGVLPSGNALVRISRHLSSGTL